MTIDQYHAFLDAEDQADNARWLTGPAIMAGVTSTRALEQRLDLLNRLYFETHVAPTRHQGVDDEVAPHLSPGTAARKGDGGPLSAHPSYQTSNSR